MFFFNKKEGVGETEKLIPKITIQFFYGTQASSSHKINIQN